MSNLDPKGLAAAWAAWKGRNGGKLGPGPAFVEAISAYLAATGLDKVNESPYSPAFMAAIAGTCSTPASRVGKTQAEVFDEEKK